MGIECGHGGKQAIRNRGAVGLAALAAGELDAEMAQRLGRVGLGNGDRAGCQQRPERTLERPKPQRFPGGKGGQQHVAPGGDGGLAGLIGAKRPEQRRPGRPFGGGLVAGA